MESFNKGDLYPFQMSVKLVYITVGESYVKTNIYTLHILIYSFVYLLSKVLPANVLCIKQH